MCPTMASRMLTLTVYAMALSLDAAATLLYDAIAPSLSVQALREYGLDPSHDAAIELLREILALDLYWAESAVTAALRKDAGPVIGRLERLVAARCSSLNRPGENPTVWLEAVRARADAYARVVQQDGEPIAVFQEAAEHLESRGILGREGRPAFLAFCIDFVPVEQFGELVEGLEVTGG